MLRDIKNFLRKKIFLKVKNRIIKDDVFQNRKYKILDPEAYKKWISPNNTIDYLNWNSYSAGSVLLLYSQRAYLEKWQSLNDMDKDHIIPYNWMNFSGPVGINKFWKVESVGPEGRYPVMNSPGNYRYWPSSLNREYQDNHPSRKYIHSEVSTKLDENHKKRFMSTTGDVLEASFIDNELLKMIQKIEDMKNGMDHRIWTTEQYRLFKRLVDKRCYKMYQNLYETMKLYELQD